MRKIILLCCVTGSLIGCATLQSASAKADKAICDNRDVIITVMLSRGNVRGADAVAAFCPIEVVTPK